MRQKCNQVKKHGICKVAAKVRGDFANTSVAQPTIHAAAPEAKIGRTSFIDPLQHIALEIFAVPDDPLILTAIATERQLRRLRKYCFELLNKLSQNKTIKVEIKRFGRIIINGQNVEVVAIDADFVLQKLFVIELALSQIFVDIWKALKRKERKIKLRQKQTQLKQFQRFAKEQHDLKHDFWIDGSKPRANRAPDFAPPEATGWRV